MSKEAFRIDREMMVPSDYSEDKEQIPLARGKGDGGRREIDEGD